MTNYAWQVTGIVIALCALAGLMFIVGTGAFRLLLALTERRQPGRHQAHIPGYDDEPGEDWSPKQEWGDRCCDDIPEGVLHSHAHWAKCDEPDCHGCAPGGDHGEKPPARGLLQLTEQEGGQSNERLAELTAPLNVTGLTASAPDAPQASPVTLDPRDRAWWETADVTAATAAAAQVPGPVAGHHPVHAIEVHPRDYWAGQYRANPPAPCWPAGDGDLDESAWTKRSALDLAIDLAYDDTAAGFDQLLREVRNYGDYAASGIQQRWAS